MPLSTNMTTTTTELLCADNYGTESSSTQVDVKEKNFPRVIMEILDNDAFKDIIRWNAMGTSFTIFDHKRLVSCVLPIYFRKFTAYQSFTRRLVRWGFRNVSKATYRNIHFRRSEPDRCLLMTYNSKMKRMENEETFQEQDDSRITTEECLRRDEENVRATTVLTQSSPMVIRTLVNPVAPQNPFRSPVLIPNVQSMHFFSGHRCFDPMAAVQVANNQDFALSRHGYPISNMIPGPYPLGLGAPAQRNMCLAILRAQQAQYMNSVCASAIMNAQQLQCLNSIAPRTKGSLVQHAPVAMDLRMMLQRHQSNTAA